MNEVLLKTFWYGLCDMSNCNLDYIKTCNNDNTGMKLAHLYFNDVSLIFSVLLIFMNTQIMQI